MAIPIRPRGRRPAPPQKPGKPRIAPPRDGFERRKSSPVLLAPAGPMLPLPEGGSRLDPEKTPRVPPSVTSDPARQLHNLFGSGAARTIGLDLDAVVALVSERDQRRVRLHLESLDAQGLGRVKAHVADPRFQALDPAKKAWVLLSGEKPLHG